MEALSPPLRGQRIDLSVLACSESGESTDNYGFLVTEEWVMLRRITFQRIIDCVLLFLKGSAWRRHLKFVYARNDSLSESFVDDII